MNEADEADLADVIYQYGEERRSRALAKKIVAVRAESPIETTGALAAIAEQVLGRGAKTHPATRLFQALRIFINDELGQIVRALIASEALLRKGGRLVAVSFHSLEDRIVKRFMASVAGRAGRGSRHLPETVGPPATFDIIGKPAAPTDDEIADNPRARSSRLRAARRTDASPTPWTDARLADLGIPPLVFSSLQQKWSVSV